MLKIGLTGNYYTGLDYIAYIFRRYKVPVFDADLVIKYMIFNSSEHILRIKDVFGEKVFTNNVVDLNQFIGNDDNTGASKFNVLLKLLEKDLNKYYLNWRVKHSDNKFIIFKSQILFEFGFDKIMDMNISVFKPDGMRISEIQTMLGIKASDAWKFIENEISAEKKNNLCDYQIHNYDSYFETTERQIAQIYRNLISKTKDVKTKIDNKRIPADAGVHYYIEC